jgi:hypothetical protein
VALTSVIALTVFVATGAASGATTGKSITLHLVEKQLGSNYIDNPPRQGFNAPPLIGDEYVFTSVLQTRSGARAGSLQAMCMISQGGINPSGPCYGVFALKGGQIALLGLLNNQNTTIVAVVGGTGVYAGVTGTMTSVSRGENSPYADDTVKLIWH